jgi:hypothetical protein
MVLYPTWVSTYLKWLLASPYAYSTMMYLFLYFIYYASYNYQGYKQTQTTHTICTTLIQLETD